jgi:hypothetical protein
MDGGWYDRIDDELGALRRAEAWERMSMEDQVLRAGWLNRQQDFVPPWVSRWVHSVSVMVRRVIAGRGRTRRASLGTEPGS